MTTLNVDFDLMEDEYGPGERFLLQYIGAIEKRQSISSAMYTISKEEATKMLSDFLSLPNNKGIITIAFSDITINIE